MVGDDTEFKDDRLDESAGELMRKEARAVLEGQLGRLGQLERQAIWIVRINAIFVGFIVTAAALIVTTGDASQIPESAAFWARLAGGMFIVSAIFGFIAFRITAISIGIDPEYVQEARAERKLQTTIRRELLDSYIDWIDQNQTMKVRFERRMFLSELSFMLGILFFLMAGIDIF